MQWENIAPMVVFSVISISITVVWVLRGPFGKALAERMTGRAGPPADVDRLRADVEELRAELGAVQERLDFAERMLARRDQPGGALRPGN